MRGLVAADVSAAAMAVAGGHRCCPGLEPGQVDALLAACDRGEPEGRRDYAVILLLARLGLRAGEAARLRLDDIGWRAAEIGIRGKGGQFDVPLPADVGAAIASWLRVSCPAGVPFPRGVHHRDRADAAADPEAPGEHRAPCCPCGRGCPSSARTGCAIPRPAP